MREVAHIPHPLMRITVHSYNGQWKLRFELDRYEQTFKYPDMEHSLEDVKTYGTAMAEEVLLRFVGMREQHLNSISES